MRLPSNRSVAGRAAVPPGQTPPWYETAHLNEQPSIVPRLDGDSAVRARIVPGAAAHVRRACGKARDARLVVGGEANGVVRTSASSDAPAARSASSSSQSGCG